MNSNPNCTIQRAKPAEVRPFNAHDAHNGAPYSTRSGKPADILLWTARDPLYPIVGVVGDDDVPMRWRADGGFGASAGKQYAEDLVMTPLGMVDDKPFFCGDVLLSAIGSKFKAEPRDQDGAVHLWRWPAPEVVKPEYTASTISDAALHDAWGRAHMGRQTISFRFDGGIARAVADASLRHALETQAVVPMADVQEVARALSKQELRQAKQDRDQRELAIAQNVREWFYKSYPETCFSNKHPDIVAIIDAIK